jgi:hypothetical protein
VNCIHIEILRSCELHIYRDVSPSARQWFCDSEPVRHARAGIKAGMGLGDAFIRGMLSALRNKLLWDLRRKARVAVAEAAMVMGVADDYGDLEYGQVFLQVSDEVLMTLDVMRVRYSLQFSASCCPRDKVVTLGDSEKPEDAGQTRWSVWFALLHIESFL